MEDLVECVGGLDCDACCGVFFAFESCHVFGIGVCFEVCRSGEVKWGNCLVTKKYLRKDN